MKLKIINSSFVEKHKLFFIIIVILVLLIVIELWFVNFLSEKENGNIIKFHAAAMILLTTCIVYIAWREFSSLNKTQKAEFLLRIDERYSSPEIIKARTEIQKLYCRARRSTKTPEKKIEIIQDEIKKLGQSEDHAIEFTLLLNFLDFLETVAYFSNRDFIQIKDIKELLGGSIEYYFDVFNAWIKYRREKYKDPGYYCELEKLINCIKKEP